MFEIWGRYEREEWEVIDSAPTKTEVFELLSEYKLAYKGMNFTFRIKEVEHEGK